MKAIGIVTSLWLASLAAACAGGDVATQAPSRADGPRTDGSVAAGAGSSDAAADADSSAAAADPGDGGACQLPPGVKLTVTYDERAGTLSYDAFFADSRVQTPLPGQLAADGAALVYTSDGLGSYYTLTVAGVAAQDRLTTVVSYTGDGPTQRCAVAMMRIGIVELSGEVSKSRGANLRWSGPPLAGEERVDVILRAADSQNPDDAAADIAGVYGHSDYQLWIDGDWLRIPPFSMQEQALRVGDGYELRATRSTGDGTDCAATYVSAATTGTYAP